jgi:hypothetical protein
VQQGGIKRCLFRLALIKLEATGLFVLHYLLFDLLLGLLESFLRNSFLMHALEEDYQDDDPGQESADVNPKIVFFDLNVFV